MATRVTTAGISPDERDAGDQLPWAIHTEADGGLTRVVISLAAATTSASRDQLLGAGVIATVAALVAVTSGGERAVIDIRTGHLESGSDRAWEAFIEAVRGLVQSLVLESGSGSRPVNVVISTVDQEDDRRSSWRYLGSDEGTFSYGATYDLREVLR